MCVGSGSTRFSTDGFRLLAFCILILWHVLTPHIQGGSRMRRSARTVLCGGYRAIGIPTATAKFFPLRVRSHFRLTARGHVTAAMAPNLMLIILDIMFAIDYIGAVLDGGTKCRIEKKLLGSRCSPWLSPLARI